MDVKIMSYDVFALKRVKYKDPVKCCIPDCNGPAYYEGGDARCWFPVCAKHAELQKDYLKYLHDIKHSIEIRMMWDKDDPSLKSIHSYVTDKIIMFYKRMYDQ